MCLHYELKWQALKVIFLFEAHLNPTKILKKIFFVIQGKNKNEYFILVGELDLYG
jgi:hypothetical protein